MDDTTAEVPIEIVILGQTTGGRTFRPGDWAERLAGLVSEFGRDNRLNYCPLVQPVSRGNLRCLVINCALELREPRIYRFMLDFARDNDLQVVAGRQKPRDGMVCR